MGGGRADRVPHQAAVCRGGLDEVQWHNNQANQPRKAVELRLVESLSYETVRLRLKKHAQAVA